MGLLLFLCEMGQNCFPTFMVSGLLSLWFLKSDEKKTKQLVLSVPLPTFQKILSFLCPQFLPPCQIEFYFQQHLLSRSHKDIYVKKYRTGFCSSKWIILENFQLLIYVNINKYNTTKQNLFEELNDS